MVVVEVGETVSMLCVVDDLVVGVTVVVVDVAVVFVVGLGVAGGVVVVEDVVGVVSRVVGPSMDT